MKKSTEIDLKEVKKLLRGKVKTKIARFFNCSVSHIKNILNGNRENDEILLYCIETAETIAKEKKLLKIKIKQKTAKIKI